MPTERPPYVYTPSTLIQWLVDQAARCDSPWTESAPDPVHAQRIRSLAQGRGINLDGWLPRIGLQAMGPNGVRLFGWLRLREASYRFLHPASGVLEGDPWGVADVEGDARRTVVAALEAHERVSLEVKRNLEVIDRALCALLGWNPDAFVDRSDLVDFPAFEFREWTVDDF